MFIECVKNNGIPYLRLVEGIRVTNKDGYRTSQKKLILSIGPLSRYDDGQPDYVARLKKSFKDGDPLIPALKPYCSEPAPEETWKISIQEGSPNCFCRPKLISHLLLDRILEELGPGTLFASYKSSAKPDFDVWGVARLLIFGSILAPGSESDRIRQNGDYYAPVLKEGVCPDNVRDTLDFIFKNQDQIIRRMHTNLVKKARRSMERVYFCEVNIFTSPDGPDDGIPDGAGTPAEKVRAVLFLDDAGIPITVETFPGSAPILPALRPALQRRIGSADDVQLIRIAGPKACGDAALLRMADAGIGYIRPERLSACTEEEQAWASGDEGYTGEDFPYRSRIRKRAAAEEKLVVCRKRKAGSRKSAGRLFVTSDLSLEDPEIPEKYRSLTEAGEWFRTMTGASKSRPLRAGSPEQMSARLLISFIALTLLRIIQIRVSASGAEDAEACRRDGLSPEQIQNALQQWQVEALTDDLYRFLNTDDPNLKRILDAFDIRIRMKLYRRAELKDIKTGMEIFR